MSDPIERDLADVLATRADATQPPPLPIADITASGRELARRTRVRRGAIAAVAAAAAVLAVAVPVGLETADHGSAPLPVTSSAPPTNASTSSAPPHPTPQTRAQQAIAEGTPYKFAVSQDGSVASLWAYCGDTQSSCRSAWELTSRGHTRVGPLPFSANEAMLTACADGFLLTSYGRNLGFVLGEDGTLTPLRATPPGPQEPEVTLVQHHGGARLVDGKLGTWSTLTDDTGGRFETGTAYGESAVAGERMASAASSKPSAGDPLELWWRSSAGATWQHRTLPTTGEPSTGPVAMDATHLAAVASHVGDDLDPIDALSVSSDGGATWTDLPASALPFADVDSMVAVGGALFVESEVSDAVYRSTDASWTHFTPVPGQRQALRQVLPIAPVGDRVGVVVEDGRVGVVVKDGRHSFAVDVVTAGGQVSRFAALGGAPTTTAASSRS